MDDTESPDITRQQLIAFQLAFIGLTKALMKAGMLDETDFELNINASLQYLKTQNLPEAVATFEHLIHGLFELGDLVSPSTGRPDLRVVRDEGQESED